MLYWVHLVSSWLVALTPTHLAYAIVEFFAPGVSRLWVRQYQFAHANMTRILGPKPDPSEVRRHVRAVFKNYARYMVDLLRLPRLQPRDVLRDFEAHGLEHLDEALARGRGVVMATAHIGNWDLAGLYLTSKGYPVHVLAETLHPPRWNDLVQRIRQSVGLQVIMIESGVKQMLGALRRNEILAVLIDRPLEGEGVLVHFFGTETRVPGGAATLALRCNANLICAAAVRRGHRFEAHVSPPIAVEPTGDAERDVQAMTQVMMTWLESLIRNYPDQWYMFRNMWPEAAHN